MGNASTSFMLCLIQLLLLSHCVCAQDSLSMTLNDQPVTDGDEVLLVKDDDYTFHCIHTGSASISWLLGTTDTTSSAFNNILTLRQVALECGLDLKCSADSLSVTVTIKIIIPPEVPIISTSVGRIENGGTAILRQNNDYTFQCLADLIIPEADFHWYLDGMVERILPAASNETSCSRVDSTDSFTLTADYDMHQGKVLQCQASNEADPVGMTSDVILEISVPPDSVAIFKDGIKVTNSVRVVSGKPTSLNCTATNAKPAATIQWMLDGFNKTDLATESTTADGGLQDTTSELTLTYDPSYCKKTLECIALHPETDSQITTSVSLDVLVPPSKPTISLVNGDLFADGDTVRITQGDTFTFNCFSEGAIPAVDFLWLLGENEEEYFISENEVTDCIETRGSFQYVLQANHLTHHSESLQCLVKNEANTDGESSRVILVVDALIGFAETEYKVSESDAEVKITLSRDGPLNERASVRLSVSQSSNVEAGSDYRFASILPVIVEFNNGESTQEVTFFLVHDEEFELDEKLVLELDAPNGGKIIPGYKTAVVTITDSGGIPRCSLDSTGKYSGCKDLDTLSKFTVSRENVDMVADTLADLTEGIPTSKATPSDVNSVAQTLENIADVGDGSEEVTSSCVEAVDSLIDGLRPSSRNESTEDDAEDDENISNSTSSVVQSLQKQITLTLRKEGSVRIVKPNIAVEGVITDRPENGIGIVVLQNDDINTDSPTTSMTTTYDSNITEGITTNMTVTENSEAIPTSSATAHTTSFPTGISSSNVEFSNETVIRIDEVDDVSDDDTIGLIYVPADFIGQPDDNESPAEAEVTFICYANPGLFPPDEDDEFIDGIVISANVQPNNPYVPEPTTDGDTTQITDESMAPTIGSFVSGSVPTTTFETEPPDVETEAPVKSRVPVIIEVVTNEKVSKEESRCDEYAQPIIHRCVFWDFKLHDGKGGWSDEGCRLNRSDAAEDRITCHCNHLTNFAVLASYKDFQHLVLDWISTIGCYVSIGALAITLLIFILFKESRNVLASKAPRQVLFQYCISLLLLYITFVVFIDRTCPEIYCDVGAILLHYFTLTSMMWMGVQSRYLYYKLANALYMDYGWFLPLATVAAWGVPIIPIIPTILLSYESYHNENYCFLVPGYVLYFGLLLPIGLIILHNLISFVIIMNRLCHSTLPNPGEPERILIKRQFQNGFAMTVLMGLTWASAFFAIEHATFIFSLVFCVLNSLQGLFVFLLFCLRQPDVYNSCKCCKLDFERQRSFEADWKLSSHSNPAYALD